MQQIAFPLSAPAGLHVVLSHLWLVLKTIAIAIVMVLLVVEVRQNLAKDVTAQMKVAIGICLHAPHRVSVDIERGARVILGLQVFHVNLPRDGLIAVFHR